MLAAGFVMRPADRGNGGHAPYFVELSAALREAGLARPTLVIDLNRLDANTATTRDAIAPRAFRVVAKSLPSVPLLGHVMQAAGTDRLMVFHQPFLNAVAAAFPGADVLLGKPLPVAAADRFYDKLVPGAFDPAAQVQWLIDTPERLRQYAELARGRGVVMRVNAEIDVGLHRGGFSDPEEVARFVDAVDRDPHLRFAGLMGYDAHVPGLPEAFGLRDREFGRVESRYRVLSGAAHDVLAARSSEEADPAGELTLNAAGSPTYRLWDRVDGVANELAVGSGLVKPLGFDIDTLSEHVPALFLATPVLKASKGLELPAVGHAGDWMRYWNPNRAQTFFIYGGYWKARPVSPEGLEENPVFGRSTNQEMLNGSDRVVLGVDDTVFYRPTQSEFVMLQFGDIAAVRGGHVVESWAPLPQVA